MGGCASANRLPETTTEASLLNPKGSADRTPACWQKLRSNREAMTIVA